MSKQLSLRDAMEQQRLESSKGARAAPPPQDSKARRRQATIGSLSGVTRIDSVASLIRRIQRSALECDTNALRLHLEEASRIQVSFELVRSLHMGKTIASLTRCTDQSVASLADDIKRKWMQVARNGLARMKRLHPKASVSELLRGASGGGIGFQSVDTTGIDPSFVLPKEIRAPRKSTSSSSSSGVSSSAAQAVEAAHIVGSSEGQIVTASIGGKRGRHDPPDPAVAEPPESGTVVPREQLEDEPGAPPRTSSSSGAPARGAGQANTKSNTRDPASSGADGKARTSRVDSTSTGAAPTRGDLDGKDPRKKRRLEV